MRPALLTLAGLALLVALASIAAAVIAPTAAFFTIHFGHYSMAVDRFKVTFFEGDLVRAWVPLAFVSLLLGVPSAIYLTLAVRTALGRREGRRRGFDVTPRE